MSKAPKPRTKFRIGSSGTLYTIVTLLILGVAVYGQTNLLFWAFGLMVGGLVVSVALSWLMMRGVEVQRLLPAHGAAEEAVVIRYNVVNRNRWMPAFGLVISETWGKGARGWKRVGPVAQEPRRLGGRPVGWVLHVGPNQGVLAEASCWPLRRGMLHFERISVSTSFPFGVIRRVVDFVQPGKVLVYPPLFRMNRRTLHRLTETLTSGRKQLERGGGNEEFFGLREYRPGDSLKTIDWKRTARTGELVTREMTQTSPPRIMIALDLAGLPPVMPGDEAFSRKPKKKKHSKKNEPPVEEHDPFADAERALSLAASLICDAHFNGYQSGMVVLGVACTPFAVQYSLSHRTRMLETLAMLDLSVRSDDAPPLSSPASVVIRPGRVDASERHGAGQTLLGAGQFEEYVSKVEGGSSAILAARTGPTSKRDQVHGGEA